MLLLELKCPLKVSLQEVCCVSWHIVLIFLADTSSHGVFLWSCAYLLLFSMSAWCSSSRLCLCLYERDMQSFPLPLLLIYLWIWGSIALKWSLETQWKRRQMGTKRRLSACQGALQPVLGFLPQKQQSEHPEEVQVKLLYISSQWRREITAIFTASVCG